MRLPPPWLAGPVVLLLELALLAAAPLLLGLGALLSPVLGGRRPLRLVAIVLAYCAHHLAACAACGLLWCAGLRGWQRGHYAVMRWFVRGITRTVVRCARVGVHVDGDEALRGDDPLVVLSRHAGEGDSLLVLHELLVRHRRRPRIVLHEALRADPLIAMLGTRLPNRFVDPRGGDIEQEIAALAGGLGPCDALLIFPEGKNFSEQVRQRGIARLLERGFHRQARWAREMRHVSAPRPGGALAAVEAAPQARVVVLGHSGFPSGLGETWRLLPARQDVHVRWWAAPAPAAGEERVDWLFRLWRELDAWAARTAG